MWVGGQVFGDGDAEAPVGWLALGWQILRWAAPGLSGRDVNVCICKVTSAGSFTEMERSAA